MKRVRENPAALSECGLCALAYEEADDCQSVLKNFRKTTFSDESISFSVKGKTYVL